MTPETGASYHYIHLILTDTGQVAITLALILLKEV